jgi:Kef-type K+ transport system membrane component KefB
MLTRMEGGLQIRLDLLKQNFLSSVLGAATGVIFPIAFSYLLLYLGYGYGMSTFWFHGITCSNANQALSRHSLLGLHSLPPH